MSLKSTVVWENSYSLGVRSLDEQHKKLFILVNKLYKLKKTQNIKEEMRSILYGFREYILTHFKEEEEYMKHINYPELQEHKKLHEDISENLFHIIQNSSNLNIVISKMKILSKRVMIEHIINEDHKINLFTKDKEIQETVYELSHTSHQNILHKNGKK